MPTRNLYFDESGFTGYNLLDPHQPVFSIASTDIGAEDALAILRESFPRYQAPEFKFQNIWASGRNRKGLETFGRLIKPVTDRIYVWRTDKPFAVLTKLVDYLVEPILRDQGYDFYAGGYCAKYVNRFYFGLTQFGDPALFDAIISTYQRFSREPTRENLEMMQWQYRTMAESHDEHIDDLLGIMALGAECFDRFHDLAEFTGTDELYVATMTAIVAHWRNRTDDDFAVFHDDSAHFFRQRQMWDAITRADAPEEVHRSGWGGDVRFPLRVTSTAAVNSKDSAAIQLCDVIAGISAKFHDDRVQGEERAALMRAIEAGAGDIEHNGIRFEPDFNEGPPPIRNGPDAIDRMMGVMFPERGPVVGGAQG